MNRLLVVDDDDGVADLIHRVAEGVGFEVRSVRNGASFKLAYDEFRPHGVVLDVLMPDMDGLELITYLAERKCEAGIIIISGGEELRGMAMRLGEARGLKIVASMAKPLRVAELRVQLARLIAGA